MMMNLNSSDIYQFDQLQSELAKIQNNHAIQRYERFKNLNYIRNTLSSIEVSADQLRLGCQELTERLRDVQSDLGDIINVDQSMYSIMDPTIATITINESDVNISSKHYTTSSRKRRHLNQSQNVDQNNVETTLMSVERVRHNRSSSNKRCSDSEHRTIESHKFNKSFVLNDTCEQSNLLLLPTTSKTSKTSTNANANLNHKKSCQLTGNLSIRTNNNNSRANLNSTTIINKKTRINQTKENYGQNYVEPEVMIFDEDVHDVYDHHGDDPFNMNHNTIIVDSTCKVGSSKRAIPVPTGTSGETNVNKREYRFFKSRSKPEAKSTQPETQIQNFSEFDSFPLGPTVTSQSSNGRSYYTRSTTNAAKRNRANQLALEINIEEELPTKPKRGRKNTKKKIKEPILT